YTLSLLDLKAGQLRASGTLTKLQPQPARVLGVLALSGGRLVTRDEIRREVWPEDTFVDFEQGLNFCIRQIRTALGDSAEAPRFVETLPRRGYRFLASIEVHRTETPLSHIHRLAVLPFAESAVPADDFFSDSLREAVVANLSRMAPGVLRVLARTSVMRLRHEGIDPLRLRRELGVDYLLEGKIQRTPGRLRVTVELVDLNDQTIAWSESYDRSGHELNVAQIDIAGHIARSVATALAPQLALRPLRRDSQSPGHGSYLKGRYFWHKLTADSLLISSRHFEDAIAADPRHAGAHAGLADCYAQMGSLRVSSLTPPVALEKAHAMAQRAIDLDDSVPEAYNASALIKTWYEYDWAGAEADFAHALELDPNSSTHAPWYAVLLTAVGKRSEALAEIHRALDLDPLSPIVNTYVGTVRYLIGDFELALAQLRQTIALDPSYYRAHFFMAKSLAELERYDEAEAAFEKAGALAPDNLEIVAYQGAMKAYRRDRRGAEAAIRQLEAVSDSRESSLALAAVNAALGNFDAAVANINRAIDVRANPIYLLTLEPTFRRLASHPAYQACLARVGLTL
ncbi:MAG TPA: tetratricopeptide repeat protein, partial [Vicinamibacterales bacterium]|nr:tetratricopeptide repeat protein [Vicinamibacterales bacterium]